jgi:hypothetical protein
MHWTSLVFGPSALQLFFDDFTYLCWQKKREFYVRSNSTVPPTLIVP